jgi:hypothetical protein
MEICKLTENSSEALPEPSSDLSEIAVRPCPDLPRAPRFNMFQMRVLRIHQQPGGNGERSAFGLIGQAAEAERTADADRAAEDASAEFGNASKL